MAASRINPTRAMHRWQLDVEIQQAIAFDQKCLDAGTTAQKRLREFIASEVGTEKPAVKKRGK
jgi:hypothetical protein